MNYAIESAFVDELDKIAATATKTDPAKWEAAKAEAKAKMGGKHSARAMQLATQIYKKKGGGYSGDKPTAKNNSLKKWGKQKWQWSGGEKKKTAAVEQGGRGVYLPENKIKRLKQTEKGKEKLRAAERKKAKANREGKQYSSHGLAAGTSLSKSAAEKVAHRCRKDILKAFEVEGGALSMKALMKRTAKHPRFQVKKELAKLKKEGIVKDHPHGDMYTDMAEKTAGAKRLLRLQKRWDKVPHELREHKVYRPLKKSLDTARNKYMRRMGASKRFAPKQGKPTSTLGFITGASGSLRRIGNYQRNIGAVGPNRVSLDVPDTARLAVKAGPLKKTASVEYRGTTFPGYNKPIRSNRKNKKFMVLVKRGDRIKLVHFGQKGYEDFTQHKDKKRQKNYLTRSAGIRNKSGKLTKDDPFSPNYWARRKLW